jgi:hypothetical protein
MSERLATFTPAPRAWLQAIAVALLFPATVWIGREMRGLPQLTWTRSILLALMLGAGLLLFVRVIQWLWRVEIHPSGISFPSRSRAREHVAWEEIASAKARRDWRREVVEITTADGRAYSLDARALRSPEFHELVSRLAGPSNPLTRLAAELAG